MRIAVIIVCALLPAVLWFMLYRLKDAREPEPIRVCLQAFLYGIAGAVPLAALRFAVTYIPALYASFFALQYGIVWLVLVAVIEESIKAFSLMEVIENNRKVFTQTVDGIIYGTSVALGFAFVENMLYLWYIFSRTNNLSDIALVFAVRSFGAMLAHTVFSGTFGYFFAKTYLAPEVIRSHFIRPVREFYTKIPEALKFHVIRTHILPGRHSEKRHSHRLLIAEGFLLSIIVHIAYNAFTTLELFGSHLSIFTVPLAAVGFTILGYLFTLKDNTRIIRQFRRLSTKALCFPELMSGRIKKSNVR